MEQKKERGKFMKRQVLTILCLIIACGILTSCGGGNKETACIDIVKACSKIADKDSFDTYTVYGEDLYKNSFDTMYGVQYDMLDDGAVLYTESGGKADEISIMHLKSNADVSIAKRKLEERISERRNMFANYKPEEVSKLDNAYVAVQGSYVALIISDDNQRFETEIRKNISKGEE